VPRGGPGVLVQETIGLKRKELGAGAQHVVASDGIDSSEVDVVGVQRAPDEVEGLRLAEDWVLVGSAIFARTAHEAFAQPRVPGVIDAVQSRSKADVLDVLRQRVPVGEEGGEA